MRVLATSVNLQLLELGTAKLGVGNHALDGLFYGELGASGQ